MKNYTQKEQAEINMISNESADYIRYFTAAAKPLRQTWQEYLQCSVVNDSECIPYTLDEINHLFNGRLDGIHNAYKMAMLIASWVEDDESHLQDDY